MKSIIMFFARQTLFGNLLTLFVFIVGIASIFLIQREAFPNINFDVVTVSVVFPGATPDDAEKLISSPLELDMQEVDGIKKLQSLSSENLSLITVFLDPDQTTEAKGKSDIQDVVDKFVDLPEGAQDPVVTSIEAKRTPMIEVTLAGDADPLEMRRTAEFLEREIESLPGVAKVVHRGLRELEVRVEPSVEKLAALRISVDEVVAALAKQNRSIPAGVLEASRNKDEARERFVRTTGEFTKIEDVENTVVRANDLGRPIRIKDIATVRYALERASILNRANGKPSLTLTVLKKEKADIITLVAKLKERIEELKPKLGSGYEVSFVNDISVFVSNRLSVLSGNFLIGLVLVLIVLPLFIPFRLSLIISLGVPFAFLGAMIVFYNMGLSINLLSMIGLIIVIGMLVDDAIVVTENSARLIQRGMPPAQAAIEGTYQVFPSVMASVLTTIVAFAPLMFMSGIFGKFVKFIPMGVILALIVSLFEVFIILPGHIASWITPQYLKDQEREARFFLSRVARGFRHWWEVMVTSLYITVLEKLLRKRYWVVSIMGLVVALSVLLAVKGMKLVLFPPEGIETFFIRTEAPVGTSLEQHEAMLVPLEEIVKQLPTSELKNFTTTIGLVQQDPNDPSSRRGSEYAQIAVFLTPETSRKRTAAEIIDDLRGKVGERKNFTRISFNRVQPGPPTGKPVSLSVRGERYEDILPAVEEIKKLLATYPGVTDISDSYVLGKEELRLKVDSNEAAAAGLSVASIGSSVRAVYEGIVATTIKELNDEVDVRVVFPYEERQSSAVLDRLSIPNPQGALIPLKQVATTTTTRGLAFHEHEGGSRQVRVTAEVDVKKTSSMEANANLKKALPELSEKFPGVKIVFGGEDEDTQESLQSLARAFGIAVLGILLILVSTFKSLLQPLLVLLTIPIGIVSVILAFYLHGLPLSFLAMMGIVALGGVIVNNAIVMVDFVNQERLNGADRLQSILNAARDRFRPIFLTTLTTVFGVLPTAYGIGGLDKFVVPIAMALGWGIMFGSLMTAFVFPAALACLDDIQGLFSRRSGGRRSGVGPLTP